MVLQSRSQTKGIVTLIGDVQQSHETGPELSVLGRFFSLSDRYPTRLVEKDRATTSSHVRRCPDFHLVYLHTKGFISKREQS
jgi:hypothetical protein